MHSATFRRSRARLVVLLPMLALIAGACSSTATQAPTAAPATQAPTAAPATQAPAETPAAEKVYKIVLSNNYVGNQWRLQMQNIVKAMVANNAPYKGAVDLKVIVAEGDPTAQIQSLQSIIATKPDAILLDASSSTALNPVLQQACAAGIVVISFDQTVTEPCTYRVRERSEELYVSNAEWLAASIDYKGNIIRDLGLPGQPLSEISNDTTSTVWKQYPDIKVVATFEGNYAPGPSQKAVASILATNKDIQAVNSLAGSDGVIQAFLQAGVPLVPMNNTGDIAVRTLELWKEHKGEGTFQIQFADNPPTFGGYALEVAWRVLHGQDPVNTEWGMTAGNDAKEIFLPLLVYNTNGITDKIPAKVLPVDDLMHFLDEGLAPDTQLPYSIPQSPVTKEQVFGQ